MVPSERLKPRKLTRRGEDVRNRVIAAMVTCIVRSGYAATTVEHVMAEAGLSRGSVLHQFPTRLELTVACAEFAMWEVMGLTLERAGAVANPYERLAGYADIMWEVHNGEYGLAVTDILLATRWDADLALALLPIASEIETQIQQELLALSINAGLADPDAFIPHGWMLLATVRGLIIEYKLNPARPMILEAIAVMKNEHRQLCERLRCGKIGQA